VMVTSGAEEGSNSREEEEEEVEVGWRPSLVFAAAWGPEVVRYGYAKYGYVKC